MPLGINLIDWRKKKRLYWKAWIQERSERPDEESHLFICAQFWEAVFCSQVSFWFMMVLKFETLHSFLLLIGTCHVSSGELICNEIRCKWCLLVLEESYQIWKIISDKKLQDVSHIPWFIINRRWWFKEIKKISECSKS